MKITVVLSRNVSFDGDAGDSAIPFHPGTILAIAGVVDSFNKCEQAALAYAQLTALSYPTAPGSTTLSGSPQTPWSGINVIGASGNVAFRILSARHRITPGMTVNAYGDSSFIDIGDSPLWTAQGTSANISSTPLWLRSPINAFSVARNDIADNTAQIVWESSAGIQPDGSFQDQPGLVLANRTTSFGTSSQISTTVETGMSRSFSKGVFSLQRRLGLQTVAVYPDTIKALLTLADTVRYGCEFISEYQIEIDDNILTAAGTGHPLYIVACSTTPQVRCVPFAGTTTPSGTISDVPFTQAFNATVATRFCYVNINTLSSVAANSLSSTDDAGTLVLLDAAGTPLSITNNDVVTRLGASANTVTYPDIDNTTVG